MSLKELFNIPGQGCGNTMSDLSNLSHFPKEKSEISIYLSWGIRTS